MSSAALRAIMINPPPPDGDEAPAPTPGQAAAADQAQGANRRRHGRLATRDVRSNLGRVLDVSRSGMRVRRNGHPGVDVGATFVLEIQAGGELVVLPVEIVRMQKVGFRGIDVGLRFRELDERQQRSLSFLAQIASSGVTPGVRNPHA